jgi:uncharacterized protein DUF4416
MMNTLEIKPVKLIAAVLYHPEADLETAYQMMADGFSDLDFKGSFFPFVESDYYGPEMGEGLLRGVVSFEELVSPGSLAEAKLKTRELEDKLRQAGGRTVNIDIGYLDMFKVVLASFKGRSNKIYLSDGVWADWIMHFEGGKFKAFFWTFPDFKSGIYDPALMNIRERYKKQLRK